MSQIDRARRAGAHLLQIARRLPAYAGHALGMFAAPQWVCLAEQEGWSISEDAKFVSAHLREHGIGSYVATRPDFIAGHILHYCSLHTYSIRKRAFAGNHNRHVLTCFHGDFGIEVDMDNALRQVVRDREVLDALIVSCTLMQRRFLAWGIPQEKLHLIPLPVDTSVYCPDPEKREATRDSLGIPKDTIVLGSFQKDGVGHRDGLEPKMIKGPDIFCDVVERLNRRYPIVVLLTGPARGYVKRRLQASGVRYVHRYVANPSDVADYYRALDLYLMSSREEGGPKSLLESLASGVPFVGTNVGMVPDVLQNGTNGWVCPVADVDALTDASESVIRDEDARRRVAANGRETVRRFATDIIGQRYVELYRKLASRI